MQKLEKENTAFKSANWNHTHEMVKLKMENQKLHKPKDKLDWLIDNDPLAYVGLVMSGKSEKYLKAVAQ